MPWRFKNWCTYILRSSPCFGNDELINYDNDLRHTLSKILSNDLSDDGWEQASLPVRCGGLWKRSAVISLAPSAYLDSAAGSASLVNRLRLSYLLTKEDPYIPSAAKLWENIVSTSDIAPQGPMMLRQKSWDLPCCQSIAAKHLSKCASSSSRARLLASQSSGSGGWFEALPLASIDRIKAGWHFSRHRCYTANWSTGRLQSHLRLRGTCRAWRSS